MYLIPTWRAVGGGGGGGGGGDIKMCYAQVSEMAGILPEIGVHVHRDVLHCSSQPWRSTAIIHATRLAKEMSQVTFVCT